MLQSPNVKLATNFNTLFKMTYLQQCYTKILSEKMTQDNVGEWNYRGDEESDSELLIKKVQHLGSDAQSVLYALITVEGEEEAAEREGVEIIEIQEACDVCRLELEPRTHDVLVMEGISELKDRGFINVRENKIYLLTRSDHARAIERGIDFSKYKVL